MKNLLESRNWEIRSDHSWRKQKNNLRAGKVIRVASLDRFETQYRPFYLVFGWYNWPQLSTLKAMSPERLPPVFPLLFLIYKRNISIRQGISHFPGRMFAFMFHLFYANARILQFYDEKEKRNIMSTINLEEFRRGAKNSMSRDHYMDINAS